MISRLCFVFIYLILVTFHSVIDANGTPSLILKSGGGRKSGSMIMFPNHSKCGSPTLIKKGGGRKGKEMIILGHEEQCKEETHKPSFYPIPYHMPQQQQHYDNVQVMPMHYSQQHDYGTSSYGYGHDIYGYGGYGGGGGVHDGSYSSSHGYGADMMYNSMPDGVGGGGDVAYGLYGAPGSYGHEMVYSGYGGSPYYYK